MTINLEYLQSSIESLKDYKFVQSSTSVYIDQRGHKILAFGDRHHLPAIQSNPIEYIKVMQVGQYADSTKVVQDLKSIVHSLYGS